MRARTSVLPSGAPSTVPLPDVGATRPSSSFSDVVLPAPFGPKKPKTSPRGTARDKPATATLRPNSRRNAAVSIAYSGIYCRVCAISSSSSPLTAPATANVSPPADHISTPPGSLSPAARPSINRPSLPATLIGR